jgi:cytochrome c oxidase cbb3-type subunit 1
MWRATSIDGTLTYSFVESLEASYPGYYVRFIGGAIFLAGMLVMAYNVYKTVRGETREEAAAPATPMVSTAAAGATGGGA